MTKYDKSSGTSIVNGAHDSGVLSKLLEVFINTYVQCYACRNPETQVRTLTYSFGPPSKGVRATGQQLTQRCALGPQITMQVRSVGHLGHSRAAPECSTVRACTAETWLGFSLLSTHARHGLVHLLIACSTCGRITAAHCQPVAVDHFSHTQPSEQLLAGFVSAAPRSGLTLDVPQKLSHSYSATPLCAG